MAPYLSKSAHYVFTFDLSPNELETVTLCFPPQSVVFYNAQDFEDLMRGLEKIQFLLYGIFNLKSLTNEQANILFEKVVSFKTDFNFINDAHLELPQEERYHSLANLTTIQEVIKRTLANKVPLRLEELVTFAAQVVGVQLFPNLGNSYIKSISPNTFTYDYTFVCQIDAQQIQGYSFVHANISALGPFVDETIRNDEIKILNYIREFHNQMLGIVNYNLSKFGILPHIGVPTVLDKYGKLHIGKIYVPTIHIQDPHNALLISVGLIPLTKDMKLDLTRIEFTDPSTEAGIDFF